MTRRPVAASVPGCRFPARDPSPTKRPSSESARIAALSWRRGDFGPEGLAMSGMTSRHTGRPDRMPPRGGCALASARPLRPIAGLAAIRRRPKLRPRCSWEPGSLRTSRMVSFAPPHAPSRRRPCPPVAATLRSLTPERYRLASLAEHRMPSGKWPASRGCERRRPS